MSVFYTPFIRAYCITVYYSIVLTFDFCNKDAHIFRHLVGATENARPDIARPSKLWGLTSRERAMRHHIARMNTEKPARGTMMHTSQQSSDVVASAAVADSDAPEVVAACTGACLSSSLSSLLLLLLLLSTRGCRDSV